MTDASPNEQVAPASSEHHQAKRRRWPRRLAWVTIAMLLGLFLYGRAWVRSGLPWRAGDFELAQLGAEVEVHFDERGVPHVQAESDNDAFAALGFLHANDRCLQLELIRRAASGRLSEVFGSSQVGLDTRMRQLGLRESAEAWAAALSPGSRAALEAYAAGVNAWFDARGKDLPPQFKLLGAAPEPWTPADSLGVALLMDLRLSPPDRQEWANEHVLRILGPEALGDLLFDQEFSLPERLSGVNFGQDRPPGSTDSAPGELGGSNNWAVAGSRTQSGSGILAGDPHLWLELPAQWYLASIHGKDYHAAGATLPGLPMVVVGGGELRAWSFTTTGLDTHDFVVEELGEGGGSVRRGDQWLAIEESTEQIDVRFGDPVSIQVRRTDLGPFYPSTGSRPAHSLQWAAKTPSDPIAMFVGLAAEPDIDSVLEAAENYVAPVQNLMFAQADGRVGYAVVGRGPRRPAGVSDGWLARSAERGTWEGLRPGTDNPRWIDPPEGYAVTANADVRPAGYSLPFPSEFAHPSRRDRALALLAEDGPWTLDAVADVQLDTRSPLAIELVQSLLAAFPDGAETEALAILEDWVAGGADFASSPGAAIFLRWTRELALELFSDEYALLGRDVPGPRLTDRLLADVLAERTEHDWWDREERERGPTLVETLRESVAWLEARLGDQWDQWAVGDFMELELNHSLGALPAIGAWLSRGPFPRQGHPSTLDAHWCEWETDEDGRDTRLLVYGGASVRYRAEPAHPERAAAGLPGGQSGHPLDRHYDDLLGEWLQGAAHTLPWGVPGQGEALRLRP